MEIKRGQIVNFSPAQKVETQVVSVNPGIVARFKFSKISTPLYDIAQYGRTTRALMDAGMTLDILADAGEERGDKVERMVHDAPSTHNLQGKVGEIIEGKDQIQAWHQMGEVLVTRQLPNPTTESGVIPFVKTDPQKIGVVEGVGVFSNQPTQIQNLSENPYLKAPADIKKAA